MSANLTNQIGGLEAGTIIGDYELATLVAAGGMGAVYRAADRRSGAIVAVKVFGPEAIEAAALARFYQEARILQSLSHAHIARFITLVNIAGGSHRPAIAMEFVDGPSVAELLSTRGRLDAGEALRVVADLASAVAHAHARDVVHRDITPANVRMTREGVVKLLDFGIARTAAGASGLTTPGKVIGTPWYLAPEQLLGERATAASDVWAIGVLLYEMTTGRVPFAGDGPAELWRAISAGRYLAAGAIAPAADATGAARLAALDAIVSRCLVQEPERRPGAADVEAAARAAIGGVVRARRQDGRRWPARRRVVRAGVAAAGLLAVFAVGSTLRGPRRDGADTVHHIDVTSGQATVIINGRRAGTTPLDYHGHVGDLIDVDLESAGYITAHEQIQLGVEGTSTFTLQPARGTGERR